MFPHERSLVKQLADQPFALIGVNSDEDLEQTRKDVKEKEINWRSFWNGQRGTAGPISTQWSVTSWPTIYVIDAKGVIRFKNVRGEELDDAITSLLKEIGHEVEIINDYDEPEAKPEAKPESKPEAKEDL